MNKFLAIKVLALATLACFSAPGQACTYAPNADPDQYDFLSNAQHNWGIYEWDAGNGQWVKIKSGYHPYFETEIMRPGDVPVPSGAFGGGGGGGGGGNGPGGPVNPNGVGSLDVEQEIASPCGTLPATVVTAHPISFGGSWFTVVFRRGPGSSGGGGGAQRSISAFPMPAPTTAAPITCGDLDEVRVQNAVHTAAHYRMTIADQGRTLTIRWSTGTVETYVNMGHGSPYGGFGWMVPVPGTCRDR